MLCDQERSEIPSCSMVMGDRPPALQKRLQGRPLEIPPRLVQRFPGWTGEESKIQGASVWIAMRHPTHHPTDRRPAIDPLDQALPHGPHGFLHPGPRHSGLHRIQEQAEIDHDIAPVRLFEVGPFPRLHGLGRWNSPCPFDPSEGRAPFGFHPMRVLEIFDLQADVKQGARFQRMTGEGGADRYLIFIEHTEDGRC